MSEKISPTAELSALYVVIREREEQIAALTARLRIEEPHPFGEGYDALDLAADRIKALTAHIKELEEVLGALYGHTKNNQQICGLNERAKEALKGKP